MSFTSYTPHPNVSIFPQFILHEYYVQVREPNQTKSTKLFKITSSQINIKYKYKN